MGAGDGGKIFCMYMCVPLLLLCVGRQRHICRFVLSDDGSNNAKVGFFFLLPPMNK